VSLLTVPGVGESREAERQRESRRKWGRREDEEDRGARDQLSIVGLYRGVGGEKRLRSEGRGESVEAKLRFLEFLDLMLDKLPLFF